MDSMHFVIDIPIEYHYILSCRKLNVALGTESFLM